MIPSSLWRKTALAAGALIAVLAAACGSKDGKPTTASTVPPASPAAPAAAPSACLSSGDGYLRAKLGGAVETQLDWPNSGTECHGESRGTPPGVRLSFRRDRAHPDLLLVFGLTGVAPGRPGREIAANVTVIVQGTSQIYGTLGDARCTIDSLEQRALPVAGTFRIEARGICTQPAHAVRGNGDVLVSTFEFAGPVTYTADDAEQT